MDKKRKYYKIEDIQRILFSLPDEESDSEAEADPDFEEEYGDTPSSLNSSDLESPAETSNNFITPQRDEELLVPDLTAVDVIQDAEELQGMYLGSEVCQQILDVLGTDESPHDVDFQEIEFDLPRTECLSAPSLNSAPTSNPELLDISKDRDSSNRIPELNNGESSEFISTRPRKWGRKVKNIREGKNNYKETPAEIKISGTCSELEIFLSIFPDSLFDMIVEETNNYAKTERSARRKNKIVKITTKNWTDITRDELKAYIGVLILMVIHQLPEVRNYWSSDPLLRVDVIANVMSLTRFKKITENLHCNSRCKNAPRGSDGHDKLHKVRPLLNKLSQNITEPYEPSTKLSIDESMIPFKGRSCLKQYMPMKPVKRGYKVWCLADATTGYILKFQVYTGKEDSASAHTLGERVVRDLSSSLRQYSLVAFDNYFTTTQLMEDLHAKKIFACGTFQLRRKNMPAKFKEPCHLQRGEFKYQTKGPVSAIMWQDSKPVFFMSNYHDPRITIPIARKNKDGSSTSFNAPEVVAAYNNIMGGVDRFDQFRERYAVGRRSMKWWHRIFYYLVDMAIVNSFILSRKLRKSNVQLQFRIKLGRLLINKWSSRKRRGLPIAFQTKQKERKASVPDEVRLIGVGSHHIVKNNNYRRCRLCSTKSNEKRTRFICSDCQVPLCVDACFRRFHQ